MQLGSLAVTWQTSDHEVTGSTPSQSATGNNPRQVVHTHVPLTLSSIIWYQSCTIYKTKLLEIALKVYERVIERRIRETVCHVWGLCGN